MSTFNQPGGNGQSGDGPQRGFVPIAEMLRGDTPESVHFGAVAVVDRQGDLVASLGDPHCVIYTRSACKPFQAMPFVAQGGPEALGITEPELAVICSSHSGEACHEEAVRSILRKAGCTERDLLCGSHVPLCFSPEEQKRQAASDFSPVLNNCSGKHAGMLAFCTLTGRSREDYIAFDHPIQQEIKQAVSYFTEVEAARITTGIDGCSAPNFTLPLIGLARAFEHLARDDHDARYGDAPRVIFRAMTAHPHLVSGTGRSDLAVMQTGGGDWVAKVGGEAVQGVGIRSRGLGIAIKIADGNFRALRPVIVEVLRQLGLVDRPGDTPLLPFVQPPEYNHRRLQTGVLRPQFKLQRIVPHAFAEES